MLGYITEMEIEVPLEGESSGGGGVTKRFTLHRLQPSILLMDGSRDLETFLTSSRLPDFSLPEMTGFFKRECRNSLNLDLGFFPDRRICQFKTVKYHCFMNPLLDQTSVILLKFKVPKFLGPIYLPPQRKLSYQEFFRSHTV